MCVEGVTVQESLFPEKLSLLGTNDINEHTLSDVSICCLEEIQYRKIIVVSSYMYVITAKDIASEGEMVKNFAPHQSVSSSACEAIPACWDIIIYVIAHACKCINCNSTREYKCVVSSIQLKKAKK